MITTANLVPVTGNTYPVKDQIKALGGKWDKDGKCWLVPEEKAAQAQALVSTGAAPKAGHVDGKCDKCGCAIDPKYTLCLKCKPAFRHTHCKQCGARPGPRGWPRIYRNGICSDCYQSDREEREMGY